MKEQNEAAYSYQAQKESQNGLLGNHSKGKEGVVAYNHNFELFSC